MFLLWFDTIGEHTIYKCEGCNDGMPCIVKFYGYGGEPDTCCYGGGSKQFKEI